MSSGLLLRGLVLGILAAGALVYLTSSAVAAQPSSTVPTSAGGQAQSFGGQTIQVSAPHQSMKPSHGAEASKVISHLKAASSHAKAIRNIVASHRGK